jgi:HD-GYP domain-containing protein (c-di-GMP phosphodiesterase class II)
MSEHDRDTAQHLEAVGRLAEHTARAMELDAVTVARCRDGARLHDIGKLDLDLRILRKKGPLTPSEWAVVKLHPRRGEQILSTIPQLAPLARIVGAHHERVDGQGYPNRLIGDHIPLESRVIAVADAFHAMIGWRTYKKVMSVNAALAELAANAGTQFDPTVVRRFVATLEPSYPGIYRSVAELSAAS